MLELSATLAFTTFCRKLWLFTFIDPNFISTMMLKCFSSWCCIFLLIFNLIWSIYSIKFFRSWVQAERIFLIYRKLNRMCNLISMGNKAELLILYKAPILIFETGNILQYLLISKFDLLGLNC